MNRKEHIKIMKQKLIEKANYIRANRGDYLYFDRRITRALHMLYGVLRGVPMEAIESKCREPLSLFWLERAEKELKLEEPLGVDHEEIVRYSRSITF
jgi:hypothetical protein